MKEYFAIPENKRKFDKILESWTGTPYLHMGTTKGKGADCTKFIGLSLVEMGILSQLEPREYYPKDWFIHSNREVVIESIDRHMREYLSPGLQVRKTSCDVTQLKYGDVLLFSTCSKGLSNHTGVMVEWPFMLHCINGRGVERSQIDYLWAKRLTYCYRLYIGE